MSIICLESLGNIDLFNRRKIDFLAGSKTQALSVLPTYDWAKEIANEEHICVISGFQSPLEKDVLEFLLKGKCGIIFVMAKRLFKRVPEKMKLAYEDHRLLFISISKNNVLRSGKSQNQERNNFITDCCDDLILSSLTEESSLNQYSPLRKTKTIF